MSEQILIEKRGSVTLLTMNKPQRRNALGTESMNDLSAALRRCSADQDIGAIVLTGSPPAFCAGSDLKELARLSVADMCLHEEDTARVARQITLLDKPVIAAVEGYALGGGCILALSCDIVVSASDVRWNLPEVRNGWLPPWGLAALLARVGPVRARTMAWGIHDVDGDEAYRIGLADEICAPGEALEKALGIASLLSELPRDAVTAAKRFFEPFAVSQSERLDAVASRLFAANALSEASQATLSRFVVKS